MFLKLSSSVLVPTLASMAIASKSLGEIDFGGLYLRPLFNSFDCSAENWAEDKLHNLS